MNAGMAKLRGATATTTMATTNARSLTPASSSAKETTAADDEALALRLQGGDTGALGALYDRHALAIRRFAARAASASEADDIVHGVFLRAMARASTFEPARGPVRGWLFGIAAKIIQEWHRSLARKARALLRATPGDRATSGSAGARRDVTRALEHLTEAKRIVVVLAEIEGCTSEEIAHILGIPVGTVWTRLHHARLELRARLG